MITLPSIVVDIVLLLVRVLLAVAFLHESRLKFADMKAFAKGHDLPLGAAYGVASFEMAAALALASGFFAQWAALAVMGLMVGTTSMVVFKWHGQYWAQRGGWEYDVLLFALASVIVCFGPGFFAIVR